MNVPTGAITIADSTDRANRVRKLVEMDEKLHCEVFEFHRQMGLVESKIQ